MDVVKAVRNYVEKMVESVSGLKVLLLDEETTKILSVVFSQSYLLGNEVYLTDRLDHMGREPLKCMSCLVFCRPTAINIEMLVEELRSPRYSEYRLYFSNFLKNAHVERLAEADQSELVKEIKEFYADYQALDSNHFTFGLDHVIGDQINAWDRKVLARCTENMVALLLSLNKRPLIRYDASSMMSLKLATELKDAVRREASSGLFEFGSLETPPLLVIVDRRSDLVTPLLLQWTYQAMIHDIYGISNGCTDLNDFFYNESCKSALLPPASRKHNLVPGHDSFFFDNKNKSFGQVSSAISSLVKEYQARTSTDQRLESLAGIKKFLEDYPQMMKMSAIISKHVEIVGELQKLSHDACLLDVSEIEQQVASGQLSISELVEILGNGKISKLLKLKLCLLYALQGSKSPMFNLLSFFDQIRASGRFDDQDVQLIDFIIKFSRSEAESELGKLSSTITRVDQNVYTQHVPPIVGLVDGMAKGKIGLEAFPALPLDPRDSAHQNGPFREMIVFIVGGSTYEEACHLERYCEMFPTIKVVLGGTRVHNGTSLIKELRATQRSLSAPRA